MGLLDAGPTMPTRAQISGLNPALLTISTAYSAEPLETWPVLFYPPVELASVRPGGRLHPDGRVDFSAICCGTLLQFGVAEIHI